MNKRAPVLVACDKQGRGSVIIRPAYCSPVDLRWADMSGSSLHEVTQLLLDWKHGDKAALDKLMPLVHEELRRIARRYMRGERGGHTLQSAALVNEAYLRLIDVKSMDWQNRAHFFAMSSQLMRRILVDHARSRNYAKRGGAQQKLSLSKADRVADKPDVDLVALDDTLKALSAMNEQQSRIVELRFFGGLTIEETAEVLGVSHATVERDWAVARAWLRRELSR
jgi:RNA polymerase sigma factor (TIGR02999 family)